MLLAGERTANIRHAFNLREGICELSWTPHPRIVGKPPQDAGPLKGSTADIEAQIYWGLGSLDWDRFTTKPAKLSCWPSAVWMMSLKTYGRRNMIKIWCANQIKFPQPQYSVI